MGILGYVLHTCNPTRKPSHTRMREKLDSRQHQTTATFLLWKSEVNVYGVLKEVVAEGVTESTHLSPRNTCQSPRSHVMKVLEPLSPKTKQQS